MNIPLKIVKIGNLKAKPGEIVLTAGHQTLVHDARVRVTEKSDTSVNARPRY